MIKKRNLNKKEKRYIEENYGVRIRSSHPFRKGMRSNVLLLNTDKGRYVLKIYHPNFDYNIIDFQARLSNHMHNDQVLTPKVFPNKEEKLVTQIEDTNCILIEFLKGKSLSMDNPNIISFAFTGLDKALKSLLKFKPNKIYEITEINTPLSKQLNNLKEIIREKNERDLDKIVLRYQDRLTEIVEIVEKKYSQLSLDKQLILGDYNLDSLLVYRGKISGIIDFDQVHLQLKCFDVVHCFDNLFIDKKSKNKSLEERVNWDKLRDTMSFFSKLDPTIYNQIDAFPLMHQILALRNIITTWTENYKGVCDLKYFESKKLAYIYRLEIPTQLSERFITTLYESFKSD